jgi:hypothetical protein
MDAPATPVCPWCNEPLAALSGSDRQVYRLADDFLWICHQCHLVSNGTQWRPSRHVFDPSCECADCLSKRGKTFQYIHPIPNLPDGSAGIYTQGETPADAMRKHLHELRLIRLGEGKGRAELTAEAGAILCAADTPLQLAHHEADEKPKHSADFTSVKWFGVDYRFKKGLQAESVRALWEAWENGTPSLSEQTIAEKIRSRNERFRLAHVFKPIDKKTGKRQTHPAWGTMIKPAGKGLFKLAPPDSESPK